MRWQVQEAKQRFSEVLRSVQTGEPQIVTRHGQDVAVIIDIDQFHRMSGDTVVLLDYLAAVPVDDDEGIAPERDPADLAREVDLSR